MKELCKKITVCTLIILFLASQANAFDFQFGYIGNNLASYSQGRIDGDSDNAFGALITIPLGKSKRKQETTFNGQNVSNLTSEGNTLVILGVIGAVAILSIASDDNDLVWE
jgi:hypothetical protein